MNDSLRDHKKSTSPLRRVVCGCYHIFSHWWRKTIQQNIPEEEEKERIQFIRKEIKTSICDHFIPSPNNAYIPGSLQSKNLLRYLGILLGLKILVITTLFLFYPSPAKLTQEIEEELMKLINDSRAALGIHPVEKNTILKGAAEKKVADMLEKSYFSHDSPDKQKPWNFIDRDLYHYRAAGENLAMGFIGAEVAHKALMQSPSHKKIILNERYNEIGIAVSYGKIEGKDTTLLSEFFGSVEPRDQYLERVHKSGEKKNIPYVSKNPSMPGEASTNDGIVAGKEIDLDEFETPSAIITLPEVETEREKVNTLLNFSTKVLYLLLFYLALSFLFNVFIHIRIQKPKVILQSLLTLFIAIIITLKGFHFIGALLSQVILIG